MSRSWSARPRPDLRRFWKALWAGNASPLEENGGRSDGSAEDRRRRGVRACRLQPVPVVPASSPRVRGLEPDPCGEAVRPAEELDPPRELPGDPQADASPFPRSEVTRRRLVESVASIDDLAHETLF